MGFVTHHFPVEAQDGIVVKSMHKTPDAVRIHEVEPTQDEQKWTDIYADLHEKTAIRHGGSELEINERLTSTWSGHQKHDAATGDVGDMPEHRLPPVNMTNLGEPGSPFNQEYRDEGERENPSLQAINVSNLKNAVSGLLSRIEAEQLGEDGLDLAQIRQPEENHRHRKKTKGSKHLPGLQSRRKPTTFRHMLAVVLPHPEQIDADQQQSMHGAPQDKVPARTMPQTAEDKYNHDMDLRPPLALARASKRQVDIFRKPARE